MDIIDRITEGILEGDVDYRKANTVFLGYAEIAELESHLADLTDYVFTVREGSMILGLRIMKVENESYLKVCG